MTASAKWIGKAVSEMICFGRVIMFSGAIISGVVRADLSFGTVKYSIQGWLVCVISPAPFHGKCSSDNSFLLKTSFLHN